MNGGPERDEGGYRRGMPERIQRQTDSTSASEEEIAATSATTSADGQRLRDEIDDLLDEIDDVLESNAEEFVKNYVQKGGQ